MIWAAPAALAYVPPNIVPKLEPHSNEEDDLIVREGKLRSRRTQISSSCQSLVTTLAEFRGTNATVIVTLQMRVCRCTHLRERYSHLHTELHFSVETVVAKLINLVNKKSSNRGAAFIKL